MGVIYNQIKQGSGEWMKEREMRVTASNASTIAVAGQGLTTYIKGKVEKKKSWQGNWDSEEGHRMEGLIVAHYELKNKVKTKEVGFVLNDKWKIALASPDRLVGEEGLLECKNMNEDKFLKIKQGAKVDKKFIYQCQMQLMISERKWCDLAIHNYKHQLIIQRIMPDKNIFDELEFGFKTAERLFNKLNLKK